MKKLIFPEELFPSGNPIGNSICPRDNTLCRKLSNNTEEDGCLAGNIWEGPKPGCIVLTLPFYSDIFTGEKWIHPKSYPENLVECLRPTTIVYCQGDLYLIRYHQSDVGVSFNKALIRHRLWKESVIE